MRSNQRGFSLVELSIVLVILGLLAGGVLTGQALIRAAELRSVTTQSQGYMVAANTFRDKYFALPGDMANATQFWGAAHATAATCYTTTGTGKATCDGNGDGMVDSADGGTTYSERFRYWQHLSNAGLIEGTYTGIAKVGATGTYPAEEPDLGVNVPKGKINSTGFSVYYVNVPAGNATWFPGSVGNFITFGALHENAMTKPAIKPEEAWNLDKKLDDDKPATGRIITFPSTNATVPNCSNAAGTDYNVSYTGVGCSFMIKAGF